MTRVYEVPKGMARSVFDSKYARVVGDGEGGTRFQTWAERVEEVVAGNFEVARVKRPHVYLQHFDQFEQDRDLTMELAKAGVLVFSGRHLQHGDMQQPDRTGDRYTNCSSALFAFTMFYQLLQGSGVSCCYDGEICLVDFSNMPTCIHVLEGPDQFGQGGHPDYEPWIMSRQEAEHQFGTKSEKVRWFKVADSAEGWAEVMKIIETAAHGGRNKDKVFIFDYTLVRQKGAPIKGQQNRPASGPVPLIRSMCRVSSVRDAGMPSWKQRLFIDDYLSQCVSIGGARRAARLALKYWKDVGVLDFIQLKRSGQLRTANMSVGVDAEFWEQLDAFGFNQAKLIFHAMTASAYFNLTGEPAFVNVDKLYWDKKGLEKLTAENYLSPRHMKLLDIHPRTLEMFENHLRVVASLPRPVLVNPCGEALVPLYGAYCLLSAICAKNAESLEEVVDAVKCAVQFTMRVNLMDFMYATEVGRTNQVGVTLGGWHEMAWKFFGMDFIDLVTCDEATSPFWGFIRHLNVVAEAEAERYAGILGVEVPHRVLTLAPLGTVAKVLRCTEGAHLPAHLYMIRWVQYPKDGEEHLSLAARGYPVKDVSHQYHGHVVVGFPVEPNEILLGMPEDRLVLASDATMEQQFEWLRRIERNWLGGDRNGQVSYTLKYKQGEVPFEQFQQIIKTHMKTIKCVAFDVAADDVDASAYAYLPEERVSRARYMEVVRGITDELLYTKVDDTLLQCASGACPIERNVNELPEG